MTRTHAGGRARPRTGRGPSILRRIGVTLAGALTMGILSSFPALADEPAASAAGAPVALGSVTATGDDQLFALAADRSAVYRWNGERTDWTKVGGPAQTLYAGGAGLFATAPETGKVFKYDGTPDAWSQIGEAGADFAVTGDRLYALNPDRTAVYEWSGRGTDWAKVGGPAKSLDAGGAGLFATGPDDKVFKYDRSPEAWSHVGESGADFAVTGDHLYGIAPDRSAVYEWSGRGTDWKKIGGPAKNLYAGGAGLFATDPNTGTLSKYDGQPDSWTKAGEEAGGFTVSDTHLYGLATDGTTVLQWTGTGTGWTPLGAPTTAPAPPPVQETPLPAPVTPEPQESAPASPPAEEPEAAEAPAVPGTEDESPPEDESGQRDITPAPGGPAGRSDTVNEPSVRMAVTAQDDLYTLAADNSAVWKRGSDGWSPISGPANAVYTGRAGVFMTDPDSKEIRKYDAEAGRWDPIGGSTGRFAITGDHLYRLTPDGIGEWTGDTWTTIGGPARNIYAGRAGLFATQPDTGDLHRYNGTPGKWTRVGGPGADFAVGHDHVYGITPDRTAVHQWTGRDTDWKKIGGPAKNLYAGGAGLFATHPDTGNILQYNGTPEAWTEIGGPGATFTVSDTQLYGLSPDRTTTFRWNGTGSDWTRIGGAADVAQQYQDEQILRHNCPPTEDNTQRDCVKEYREAKKLIETSVVEWLQENGYDIILDTIGVDDIIQCTTKGDAGKCLTALADAAGTALGYGLAKKGGKLAKALYRVSKELPQFLRDVEKARKTYAGLRQILDRVKQSEPDKPQQREPACATPQPSSGTNSASATTRAGFSTTAASSGRSVLRTALSSAPDCDEPPEATPPVGCTSHLAKTMNQKLRGMTGPVCFRAPAGADVDQINELKDHIAAVNAIPAYWSGKGRVMTSGAYKNGNPVTLGAKADKFKDRHKRAVEGTAFEYKDNVAGHLPDTTWSGKQKPFCWHQQDGAVNSKVGDYAQKYAVGYRPTGFYYAGVTDDEATYTTVRVTGSVKRGPYNLCQITRP